MRPAKLSSNVFLELPPVLAHYVEADRHLWIDGNPRRGRLSMLNRSGKFVDLEAQAVERRQLIEMMGVERARGLQYRMGFEHGRRDAQRHIQTFNKNTRLALQAALVFGQLQGRFVAETKNFEFNLDESTLHREVELTACSEAAIQTMTRSGWDECVCWNTAGYLSGHVSEILGRHVITLETSCLAHGGEACNFTSRLDAEFGAEADWVREAMRPQSFEQEIEKRDRLIEIAQKAARRAQAALGNLNNRHRSDLVLETVVADSEAMTPVVQRARQLMATEAPIIITGEPGTGKETLARTIHYGSERKRKPFVEVDCDGISDLLVDQELFGYEQDAFQGATLRHTGAYVRAHGGTLFLNKVCELSIETQGRLLKAMDTGAVEPLGADELLRADVRIIAATHEDPKEAVESGRLREDFYYTLAVGRLDLPPLRERQTDILRLAEDFLRDFQKRYGRAQVAMSGSFKKVVMDCAWPGNVRQLRNVIEHAVIMSGGGELTPADLPEEILATRWTRQPGELTEEVIRATLSKTHNNRSRAAQLLGVGRTTLWRSMKRYGIE